MKYTRFLHVGIGGIKCNCCFPGPSGKKYEYRKAKMREKRAAIKAMFECIEAN